MTYLTTDVSVPAQNSADNAEWGDVIGNKTDNEAGDSLYSLAYINSDHIHGVSRVVPSMAGGNSLTAGGNAWTLGAEVVLIASATVADPFDVHYINIENISAVGTYELVLYYGDSDLTAGSLRFTKNANLDSADNQAFMTPLMPANTAVKAKLSGDTAGSIVISLAYHTY